MLYLHGHSYSDHILYHRKTVNHGSPDCHAPYPAPSSLSQALSLCLGRGPFHEACHELSHVLYPVHVLVPDPDHGPSPGHVHDQRRDQFVSSHSLCAVLHDHHDHHVCPWKKWIFHIIPNFSLVPSLKMADSREIIWY